MTGPATRAALACWLLGLALVVMVGGCRKADEPEAGPVGPPPMTEAEQRRGLQACRAYAERVCRCAKADQTLSEACQFSSARVDGLESSLGIVNDGHGRMAVNDQIASQTNARRIIDKCFEADARLGQGTCPREAPAGAPGAAAPGDAPADADPAADPAE